MVYLSRAGFKRKFMSILIVPLNVSLFADLDIHGLLERHVVRLRCLQSLNEEKQCALLVHVRFYSIF